MQQIEHQLTYGTSREKQRFFSFVKYMDRLNILIPLKYKSAEMKKKHGTQILQTAEEI